jgi:ribosomal protein L37E
VGESKTLQNQSSVGRIRGDRGSFSREPACAMSLFSSGTVRCADCGFGFDQNPRTFELGRQVGSNPGQDLNL